jgi:predicted ATP-grasp superfamily ATP-dependent carboligase
MAFKRGLAVDAVSPSGPSIVNMNLTSAARPVSSTQLDVLLLDAEHRQTLASMRDFARAGLRVGVVVSESDAWWAPSARSRWCHSCTIVPDLAVDAEAYATAVLAYLDEHPARMLLPTHDGSIQAIRLRRAEFERRTALALAGESALDIAISKSRTLALASELGIAIPRSIVLRDVDDVGPAFREIGGPAVLKPLESWVERDGKGCRLSPNVVNTADEARAVLQHVLSEGGQGLIQPWLPGRREAVSLFYAAGRVWARVAQTSYREWPVLGGASTLCETIPLLPDIARSADLLVQAMGLEGCSMVEFRRDRDGQPVLMEVNPRMGGSVALAIAAGVNFPRLLANWKLGGHLEAVRSYAVGKRLRWLPGDIWNLKCAFENQGHPDLPSRSRALRTFVGDFLRPSTLIDGVELSDLKPTFAEWNKIVIRHSLRRARNIVVGDQSRVAEPS